MSLDPQLWWYDDDRHYYGTIFDDYIIGSRYNDVIDAGGGDDIVEGRDGNDNLAGKGGNDDVYGDDGRDTVTGGDNRDFLDGGRGDDRVGGGRGADTLYGGPGNDLLGGDSEPDVLFGGPGRDTLVGGTENDTLDGGTSDDTLDGGPGADLAVYPDLRGDDVEARRLGPDTVVLTLPDGSQDRLVSVERAEFSDGILDLRPASRSEAFVFRLYDAVFDRPADSGLTHWVDEMTGGMTEAEVAKAFIASPEYASRFGEDLSDAALIGRLYDHVLGREADGAGSEFWLARLDDGLAREDMLMFFTESPENLAAHAEALEAGMFYLA